MSADRLLLFDIDGTLLLKASREHVEAMRDALRTVLGIGELVPVPAAGRTDLEIARHMAVLSGVPAVRFDEAADALTATVAERYAELVPDDLSARLAPGVPELLEGLSARADVQLSLVTGNLEPVARMKLAAAGIGHHFPAGQGGFGSDHEDRTMLPPIARGRAGATDRPHPRERTVVIGDTPRDIACARADGLRCVAVAGGPYRLDALVAADAVASDARGLLSAIDGLA